ncbi:MAG: methyltransferase domain-containing protein [Deltaproteobacteria bacterium]|nr:methyltransferase domain-containing protein [Deltaproteobacteria bacterium]
MKGTEGVSMVDSASCMVDQDNELDYLCVDSFLRTLVDARALLTAFELRLIDHLAEKPSSDAVSLSRELRIDGQGLRVLLHLLQANEVVESIDSRFNLTRGFRKALRCRDLLVTKLEFTRFVLPDFAEGFTTLLTDPSRFMSGARVFDLFSYGRCLEPGPENYAHTERWMRVTTCLTRYEALVCLRHHDFSSYARLLDIGGNSGEFALRVCRRHPRIQATVLDLPVVCEVGMRHLAPEPERDRITFLKGNALRDELPQGFDLVVFKSMLHDWPEEAARHLIVKASQALKPGGTLLIFERGPLEEGDPAIPYSMIPFLLFFRSFRSPSFYEQELRSLSFTEISTKWIRLETPFFLLTATYTPHCAR